LKINRRFRGTLRIHFQGRIICQTRNQLEVATINLEDGGEIFPPKLLLTFKGLHGIISQKIQVFIATSVRTLYLSYIECSSKILDLKNSLLKYTIENIFTSA
jgi:hypothetical protein